MHWYGTVVCIMSTKFWWLGGQFCTRTAFPKASVCCLSTLFYVQWSIWGRHFWILELTLYWMLYFDRFVDLEDHQAKVQGNQRCRTGVSTLKQPQSLREISMTCWLYNWAVGKIQLLDTEKQVLHFWGGWRIRVVLSFLGAISLLGSGPLPPALKTAMGSQVLMSPSPQSFLIWLLPKKAFY